MELNSNLVGVQGVLVSCIKQTPEFTKINYTGGNEDHILFIVRELTRFLTSRGFSQETKEKHIEELNEIVFFLALNTTFKKQLRLEEHSHLNNIIPQLSTCLLANICFRLDLCKQYGFIIEKCPLEVTEELLHQMFECVKRSKPKEYLDNVFVLLIAIATKLSATEFSNKTEECIEDIVIITNVILQNITGLFADQSKPMKAIDIYQHIGYTLLNLFNLLLYVDGDIVALKKFIKCVLATTCTVVKSVTLNVFCAWAEVQHDDQPLQIAIATKAYEVLEKYQKQKSASELVSMLASIARKPKTLSELIQEADVPTIIKRVNQKSADQKSWFRALLNTPVFQNPKIVKCLNTWWRLCDESDIERLLSLPVPSDVGERLLIVKCASNLCLESLLRILTVYFHREKFVWREDIQDQLVLTFNRIDSELSEDELKNMLLLLLQNAPTFFYYFNSTAFKCSSETNKQIFSLIQGISVIDDIGLNTLMRVFDENRLNVQNKMSYIKLLETLLNCQYYSWDFIVSNVVLRIIDKYRNDEENLEAFCCSLQILKHFENLSCELSKEVEVFEFVLTCASENRCRSYLEFNGLKEEITRCCVDYVLRKCQVLRQIEDKKVHFSSLDKHPDDAWSNYYKKEFLGNRNVDFVECLLPNFDLINYKSGQADENFTRLLKILPRCVSTEWRILLKELEDRYEFAVILNALTDIMILLCDITENQGKGQGEGPKKLVLALKFCLQNFGRFLVLDSKSKQDKILAINNVCRVLRHIPDLLKPAEGMALINILPEDSLKSLAQDKEFIARIVLINDKQICKALAQKVLGKA